MARPGSSDGGSVPQLTVIVWSAASRRPLRAVGARRVAFIVVAAAAGCHQREARDEHGQKYQPEGLDPHGHVLPLYACIRWAHVQALSIVLSRVYQSQTCETGTFTSHTPAAKLIEMLVGGSVGFCAGTGAGHVGVSPGSSSRRGDAASIELSQLRAGPHRRRLAVQGAGVTVLGTSAGRAGAETRWGVRESSRAWPSSRSAGRSRMVLAPSSPTASRSKWTPASPWSLPATGPSGAIPLALPSRARRPPLALARSRRGADF